MTDMVERAYRKPLSCEGLIYLGLEEHQIRVINLSLTGLLAELDINASVSDIKSIFNNIQISPLVDIYLPKLQIADEAEVTRIDATNKNLRIALEFQNLSYDIDRFQTSRHANRKNMSTPGQMIIDETVCDFNTENTSVDGIVVRIQGKIDAQSGKIVHLSFKHLELQGKGEVVWTECSPESTLVGLKYLHLERDSIQPA